MVNGSNENLKIINISRRIAGEITMGAGYGSSGGTIGGGVTEKNFLVKVLT